MATPATLAGAGEDPRLPGETNNTAVRPQHRKLHDSSITFEEYHYYANLTRAEEDASTDADIGDTTFFSLIVPPKNLKGAAPVNSAPVLEKETGEEKTAEKHIHGMSEAERLNISDDEWHNASRAIRVATWAAVFYLITTDILGPFGVPFALGTLGWGPGIALYTVFGGLAIYGGFMLYYMFLGLDSHSYPMRTYGDIAFRLYGSPMRHMVNILQSIQLLFNVGVIVISNGQALSQVSKFKLCYAICCLVFALTGFILGQVRTLQKYGWLANAAIWMNVFIIICTMGVAAHSAPNYDASGAAAGTALGGLSVTPSANDVYPPVHTSAGLPASTAGFTGAINGLMQAVYAYGGAMLFTEFMSEMRKPRNFWKGMICAQVFIYLVYIFYGCFMYGYQGQYAVNPSYQGISPYAWQTVGNVISFISALIAAGLYGNIGIKVLYNNIFMEFFKAPPLTTRRGKILWAGIVPIYWSIAYIVAAAIPNFFGLSSLVAALCILQFTYTFPPMLYVGYCIKLGAQLPGEGFDPVTGTTTVMDGGLKRVLRGYRKRFIMNTWNVLYLGGALVTAGLGAYSAIEALIEAFKKPQITAFTCKSPVDSS
ncbi:amino acid transporter protein [Rutstroemia sp. NJR-2017a WRK4]|nr:amino acid transporter protein [Rutstroemia sp. NJR-2017a WRK4]